MQCGFGYEKIPHDFYDNLAWKTIDNDYENFGPTAGRDGIQQAETPPIFYPIYHATKTKRNRNKKDRTESCYINQKRLSE